MRKHSNLDIIPTPFAFLHHQLIPAIAMAHRRRRTNTSSRPAPAPPSGPAPRAQKAADQRATRGVACEPGSPSCEEFDLDAIGPDSDDEDASVPPSDRIELVAGSLGPSPAPSVGSAQVSSSKKSRVSPADDVWYFFERGSQKEDRKHVCRKCK
jgi:hypothetical protein